MLLEKEGGCSLESKQGKERGSYTKISKAGW